MNDLSASDVMPASALMKHVAELTSRRERHELEHSLLDLIVGFLNTTSAEVFSVRETQGQWEIKNLYCHNNQHLLELHPDSQWGLPSEQQQQALFAAQQSSDMLPWHDGKLWLPVHQFGDIVELIEMPCQHPLQPEQAAFLLGVLRIHANYLQLLYEAERDMLTGLLNRRKFDTRLYELLANRDGEHVLALIDIDHFKPINDNYGHIVGDEVLLLTAGLLLRHIGQQGQVYRYGGEEFAVLLQHNTSHAQQTLDLLRQQIAQHDFPQVGHLTISIGFVEINQQGLPAHVVEEADKALYYAKEHGRNAVYGYHELLMQGLISQHDSNDGGEIELF